MIMYIKRKRGVSFGEGKSRCPFFFEKKRVGKKEWCVGW